ncbi:MAG: hypothetical protein H6651_03690 [Ardenticatenales bacterium]|nr:hypothetical protein [Ardenticatenales bacterium]
MANSWRRLPLAPSLLLLAAALAIFWLSFRAPVSKANSDPRLSLLVSLAIIEQGSVRLDAYEFSSQPPLSDPDNARVLVRRDGHIYYAFPLGTSLAAVPPVWLARLSGRDLTIVAEQNRIQNGLAAISTALIFWLIYQLGRNYLPWQQSYGLALLLTLGSMVASTLATALWSHHLTAAAMLLALLLLTGQEERRWRLPAWPVGLSLGGLLFIAYLARPAAVVFIVLLLGYLLWRQRALFWPALIMAGALFGLFLLWSQHEFGTPFPFYYRPERLAAGSGTGLLAALYGQLLSPSRGLFVFVPYLLLLPWGTGRLPVHQRPWLWLVLAWGLGQLLLNQLAAPWWGGWSYGPRLLLDWWPGLVLLVFLLWPRLSGGRTGHYRVALFAVLGLVAIWIHSYQGLFNVQTGRWNGAIPPNIDEHPEIAFSWRYPQIGTSAAALCERNEAFVWERIATIAPVTGALHQPVTAPTALYPGWSDVADDWRWSECERSSLLFNLGMQPSGDYVLLLETRWLGVTEFDISLNEEPVTSLTLPGATGTTTLQVLLPGELMQAGLNELTFHVPGAGTPDTRPPYRLGLGLASWSLSPPTSR